VERNLDLISKMPLGQMVDQVLKEGIGELGNAPWESLEELGALAQQSLEEPLGELAEMLDEGSEQRREVERSALKLKESLNRLKQDLDQKLSAPSDTVDQPERSTVADADPRVKALKKLRQRKDVTPDQRERIDQLIRTITDANALRQDPHSDSENQPRIVRPHGDQIKRKVEREKAKQDRSLQQFNDDLRRSSEESRKSLMKARELESRNTLRADGKRLTPESKASGQSSRNPSTRVPREARSDQTSNQSSKQAKQTKQDGKADSELDLLRQEIQQLRDEVKRLKEESDK
jgi:hypothetical protein